MLLPCLCPSRRRLLLFFFFATALPERTVVRIQMMSSSRTSCVHLLARSADADVTFCLCPLLDAGQPGLAVYVFRVYVDVGGSLEHNSS